MVVDKRIRPYCIVKVKKHFPEIMPFTVVYDKTVKIINLNNYEI